MFWRFGGYANISTIDTILEKPDVTLEELLDESDLIQELKQHNTKLIEYLREDKILERLLEYVVAPKIEPPTSEEAESSEGKLQESEKGKERSFSGSRGPAETEEEEKEKKRNRYAYVAAEVLSSDNWSICESLMENQGLLRKFWKFLELSPPLDPLQASYFTKVNEALLDKKTEEMLDLFKSLDGAVKNMLQHVDSPMVMDLLLKIISLEKADGGQGIVDWLHSQDLMPILLSFLSSEHSWATQTSAGDFLKAIITISANASQNEQSCIGPNELTRQLVSQPCIEKLISDMLKGGNPLTVGVGIVIEVIRKNNSDYDPDVGTEASSTPSSRDPIYLGTLLRMFAQRVPDFMELILSPNHTIGGGNGPVTIRRKELSAAFGGKIEPLGFDRFKTCELMAELLHCSNMGLLNEVGSEEFVKARDAERERLKTEGKLGLSSTAINPSSEDLTMKTSTQNHLGSPDGLRRLEVQNVSDDDGFEEVTHSTDLGDDAKDDFDEKPESAEEDLLTPTNSGSFMDKDDEEFVDEPLSSPRLKAEEPVHLEEPEMTVLPLSPTKEIANQIDSLALDLKDEDTAMTSPPPLVEPGSEGSSTSPIVLGEPLEFKEESCKRHTNGIEHDELLFAAPEAPDAPLPEVLEHPEDKPAPLFAKKTEFAELSEAPGVHEAPEVPEAPQVPRVPEVPAASEAPEAPTAPEVPTALEALEASEAPEAPHQSSAPEVLSDSLDTTMGEVGDTSSNSILMGNTDESHAQSVLSDAPTAPVVGDFLKMQFVDHKVVPTILDFFFRFPWNNFLHNVVYDVVQQVFNGPMDRGFNRSLAIDLFETGDITMRIVDGQKKSDEAQEKEKMRLGYMGHLTLIAEEVVKFTERHPPELLSESVMEKVMNGEWATYVEVTLAETRERDNAILGGVRPDMSVGPRQAVMNAVNAASNFSSASSALAEAGLNGSIGLDSIDLANGNGASGFTLSHGTLLSGFGSSSDEEDDEMEEDNEEESSRSNGGAEFSRYISTPSTTTATTSDLAPPAAPPPPPPPLNIPPSRARRQLTARLALHSKQNNEMITENGEKAETPEHRKSLNPFAADEDDDSGDEGDFSIGDIEGEDVKEERTGLILKNVGILFPDTISAPSLPPLLAHVLPSQSSSLSTSTTGIGRAGFPSLWPFGGKGTERARSSANYEAQGNDSDSEGSDSDEEKRGRRLSATTEAKRRTSLEDDDEEDGVVHVGMAEVDVREGAGKEANGEEGDGELVEIQHAEMQGVEGTK